MEVGLELLCLFALNFSEQLSGLLESLLVSIAYLVSRLTG